MLVALGLATLVDGTAGVRPTVTPGGHDHERVHVHAHPHGDYVHTHAHGHDPESYSHAPDQTLWRPTSTHGLARWAPIGWSDH